MVGLTTAGLQVPVMLLLDVVGKAGTASPVQLVLLFAKLNVGVMLGFTVTVNVVPRTAGAGWCKGIYVTGGAAYYGRVPGTVDAIERHIRQGRYGGISTNGQ